MIYTDYHLHTTFSHDGISTMEEHIKNAINIGLKEICFTEHYDIYDGLENNKLNTIDVKNYVENFNQYKDKYKDKISLKLGIEIGLQPDIKETIHNMVKQYNFDFIIGSSHITCKKDISKDPTFFDGLTQKEAYMKYFKEVLENIKLYDEFDVYGHIDYIVRYGGYQEKTIQYSDYQDILDEILANIIKKEKGIEVNTSGYRYGLNMPHPNIEILTRYYQLGGRIITIGSDAHKVEDVCSNFEQASSILKKIGYENYAIFENRKPKFIKL
ncbi:MAG: histidinol-phosphatase HisJ family protein [Clostridia bacterium]|nr:histidinol-phosphatase HisJ family protein [Clostridia bacterium]